MELYYQQIDDLEHRLKTCTRNYLDKFGHHLHSLEQQLHANSLPTALKRGFSYLSDEDGNLIRSIGNLNPGMRIRAHLTDGSRPLEVLPENSD